MRKLYIAGNWKMNLDRASAMALAEAVCEAVGDREDIDVGLFPPAIYLSDIVEKARSSPVRVGAQNCCDQEGDDDWWDEGDCNEDDEDGDWWDHGDCEGDDDDWWNPGNWGDHGENDGEGEDDCDCDHPGEGPHEGEGNGGCNNPPPPPPGLPPPSAP